VKAYRGTAGLTPCLLKLHIILDSFTHQLLYTRERSPWHPALAPHSQSGYSEEKKKIFFSLQGLDSHCLVTILTTLTQMYLERFSVLLLLFNNNNNNNNNNTN
jgi:hypothetical protein